MVLRTGFWAGQWPIIQLSGRMGQLGFLATATQAEESRLCWGVPSLTLLT